MIAHCLRWGTSCHDCPVTRITTSRRPHLDRVGGLCAGCFCLCKAYAGRHSRTHHIGPCCCQLSRCRCVAASVDSSLGVSCCSLHAAIRVSAITRYPEHGATSLRMDNSTLSPDDLSLFVIVLYHAPTTRRGRYVNIRDSVPSARQQSKLSHSHHGSVLLSGNAANESTLAYEYQPIQRNLVMLAAIPWICRSWG